jgi:gluconokinase
MSRDHRNVVVMGVAGTGKSTVGERLGYAFVEGDQHHPTANIEKMAAGTPLTDDDRLPWLQALAELLAANDRAGRPTVLTCSALRRHYRDVLRAGVGQDGVFFVHLHAPYDVLLERMSTRSHFMPPSLLGSQFDTLEPLEDDELGQLVDVSVPIDDVVAAALAAVT